MLVSLVHRGDQVVLVRPLVLDHRVVHAFQVLLEVQVVHHVLPYQVHLEVEVVEVGAGVVGVGEVAAVLNNTRLNMKVHMKMDIHIHMGWLLFCSLQIVKRNKFEVMM